MEVVVPVMAPSAPCSPRTAAAMSGTDLLPGGYHYFFSSAPTSPSRASSYTVDDHDAATFDFAFGFSGQLHESRPILAAADELFEGGRIRPLNGPHSSVSPRDFDGLDYPSVSLSPRSPRRSRTMMAVRGEAGESESAADQNQTRGRSGRPALATSTSSVSSRSRRATRSLSPYRGDSMSIDDEFPSSPPSPRGAASLMRGCGSSGSRKWRLKDLFLFRSASEGRASGGKDPLLKYSMLKGGSGSGGEGSASMRIKGRGSAASASDMAPYTVSRAAAEEMRRRTTTPLPFHRNSLFGYLRSNPAIHTISRKLSSYSSSNRGRNASSSTTTGYAHA
ncbi:uncharacterized protein LOC124676942 [Lolium rigidum]|uniref:uncharacterized protein LOC124676942 n=1 Tax=Lolium rigidum TaxID=89674 RepID=UPI001F5DFB3B|nr:uncharacterized protein LOC124676942 [Lolium rigidum]